MALAFTKFNIDQAPEDHGVYRLWHGLELIYIGCAWGATGTMRRRLQRHFNGDEGRCTQGATQFECTVTPYPLTTEEQLLKAHKAAYGRLPRCNDRVG